jgi:hypothetical protein
MSPRRNWDPPTPSPASDCAPPPRTGGGGGAHSPAEVRGWGSPNSDDWRKILALCLLCDFMYLYVHVNFLQWARYFRIVFIHKLMGKCFIILLQSMFVCILHCNSFVRLFVEFNSLYPSMSHFLFRLCKGNLITVFTCLQERPVYQL